MFFFYDNDHLLKIIISTTNWSRNIIISLKKVMCNWNISLSVDLFLNKYSNMLDLLVDLFNIMILTGFPVQHWLRDCFPQHVQYLINIQMDWYWIKSCESESNGFVKSMSIPAYPSRLCHHILNKSSIKTLPWNWHLHFLKNKMTNYFILQS